MPSRVGHGLLLSRSGFLGCVCLRSRRVVVLDVGIGGFMVIEVVKVLGLLCPWCVW